MERGNFAFHLHVCKAGHRSTRLQLLAVFWIRVTSTPLWRPVPELVNAPLSKTTCGDVATGLCGAIACGTYLRRRIGWILRCKTLRRSVWRCWVAYALTSTGDPLRQSKTMKAGMAKPMIGSVVAPGPAWAPAAAW